MTLAGFVDIFEFRIKDFIAANSNKISFDHPQYVITKVGPGNYEVTMSVTGYGIQKYTAIMHGDEFIFKSKMVVLPSEANYPVHIVSDFVMGVFREWLSQSAEMIAVAKAKSAAADATLAVGHPVNAVVKLMPAGTNVGNLKSAKPLKEIHVDGPVNPVASSKYK